MSPSCAAAPRRWAGGQRPWFPAPARRPRGARLLRAPLPIFLAAVFDADAAACARPAASATGRPVHVTIPTDNPWVPLRILALARRRRSGSTPPSTSSPTDGRRSCRRRRATTASAWITAHAATQSLLDDLRCDRGMEWIPSAAWLTQVASTRRRASLLRPRHRRERAPPTRTGLAGLDMPGSARRPGAGAGDRPSALAVSLLATLGGIGASCSSARPPGGGVTAVSGLPRSRRARSRAPPAGAASRLAAGLALRRVGVARRRLRRRRGPGDRSTSRSTTRTSSRPRSSCRPAGRSRSSSSTATRSTTSGSSATPRSTPGTAPARSRTTPRARRRSASRPGRPVRRRSRSTTPGTYLHVPPAGPRGLRDGGNGRRRGAVTDVSCLATLFRSAAGGVSRRDAARIDPPGSRTADRVQGAPARHQPDHGVPAASGRSRSPARWLRSVARARPRTQGRRRSIQRRSDPFGGASGRRLWPGVRVGRRRSRQPG